MTDRSTMASAYRNNTEDTIDSLRRNIVQQGIRIELNQQTNLTELQEALRLNTNVKDIELLLANSFEEKLLLQEQQCLTFFRVISSRPNLNRLILNSITSEQFSDTSYCTMPIVTMSEILNYTTSSNLSLIHLGMIALQGDTNDFDTLEEAFQNQLSLRQLHCSCWLAEETRMINRISLDRLLKAIASSRSLESLIFRPAFFASSLSGGIATTTIGILCNSPSLQSLNIGKCNLTDDTIVVMATMLEHNTVMTELRISAKIGEQGTLAIAQCLRNNNKLQLLIIHNTATATATVTPANANTTNDEYNIQIAEALKVNSTLCHFALFGIKLGRNSQRAFVEMIKENYSLKRIDLLEVEDDDWKAEIDMFTLLNRCGRQRLLQNGGNSDSHLWIDTMALVSDQLDCLFYLLSIKPSLCDWYDIIRNREASLSSPDQPRKRKRTNS